jgi:hypothetical protein
MRDNRVRTGQLTFYAGLDDLSGFSDAQKIAWFRVRLEKVVFRPLREVRALGPTNDAIWDLNLGVVTIICSAVEAMGSFYSPGIRDQDAFIRWVTDFMDPIYRQASAASGRSYADILYGQFRCGLAHGLSIEGHEIATRPGTYLLDQNGYVSIDLWTLFEDAVTASERYLATVEADTSMQKEFIKRFDQIFVKPY